MYSHSLYKINEEGGISTMQQTLTYLAIPLLLFSILSCGSTDNPVDDSKEIDTITETEAETELGEGLVIGTHAPDFKLFDGYGNTHTLSEHLDDDKNVVIVFYRTGG